MAAPLLTFQPASADRGWPGFPGFGYAGWCRPAMTVGGDVCEIVPLSGTALLLVMADVMGKGILAALFASSLRALIRGLVVRDATPARCLGELNRLMFDQLSRTETFITAQLVVADLRRRVIEVANAGHCPLLVTDGCCRTEAIAPSGIPLGVQKNATFDTECSSLPPFGSILLYTDGITEARNPAGNLFGPSRLERWFLSRVGDNLTAGELKRSLLEELAAFREARPPDDDQSFLILSDETPRPASVPAPPRSGLLSHWFRDRSTSTRNQKPWPAGGTVRAHPRP